MSQFVTQIRYAVWARLMGLMVLALAVLGGFNVVTGRAYRLTNADAEVSLAGPPSQWVINLPALLSFVVLALAALMWWAAADAVPGRRGGALGRALAVFLGYMGLDEVLGVHEHLEAAVGEFWEVLYAPLMLGIAVVGLVLVIRLVRSQRRSAWLLVVGGAAWVVAQCLEAWQLKAGTLDSGTGFLMLTEETLEIAGSAMIGLAGLCLLHPSASEATATGQRADEDVAEFLPDEAMAR